MSRKLDGCRGMPMMRVIHYSFLSRFALLRAIADNRVLRRAKCRSKSEPPMMRTPSNSHSLHPFNSARPVDSRWHRINDLADFGKLVRSEFDDDWVIRGLRYVNSLRACRDKADRERLVHEFPDLDAAYRLHTTADKMKRTVVEARLLARQTVEEVAAACNLPVDAVIAYEKIFFQVLGRL